MYHSFLTMRPRTTEDRITTKRYVVEGFKEHTFNIFQQFQNAEYEFTRLHEAVEGKPNVCDTYGQNFRTGT